jgi:hypothetical protein
MDQPRNLVVLWWTTGNPANLVWPPTNLHSWLGPHVVPARSWLGGSTKEPYTTWSCCSCHHAARTWPRRPPGPSNQAYLSAPHLEAHWHRPFALVLHLHRHQSSHNLHLQYLDKSQSTQHC